MDVLSYQQIVDFLLSSAEKRKWPEKILVSKILALGYLLYGQVICTRILIIWPYNMYPPSEYQKSWLYTESLLCK